jgi:hypothetical protein
MIEKFLYALAFLWLFYTLYVFTMSVYRAKLAGRLCGLSLVLLYPVVVVAAVFDVVCNFTLACIVFWELPKELLVTARLQRHHARADGWRSALAAYVCDMLLDPFDPTGNHC